MHRVLSVFAASLILFSSAFAQADQDIMISGSSTLFPFSSAVANKVQQENGITIALHQTGTGAGFSIFCSKDSKIDIVNASRRITESEIAYCRENGIQDLLEFPAGKDGIVLAQSGRQKPMALSLKDIYLALALKTPVSDTDCTLEDNERLTWDDVNGALPHRVIEIFGPPDTSGTRDAFMDLAMVQGAREIPCLNALYASGEEEAFAKAVRLREDGTWVDAGENDDAVVAALYHVKPALAVFGFSQIKRNKGRISALPIEGVAVSEETIASDAYPLSRKMWFYLRESTYDSSPAIAIYTKEFYSEEAVGKKGYLSDMGLVVSSGSLSNKISWRMVE